MSAQTSLDWRAAALALRQGASLLRALASTTAAIALQSPQTHKRRGRVSVSGIDAPIEILRDRWGVPHCFAESGDDALFALGYVHAQDRLWQMQWSRRAALGRISEVAGPQALPTDRLARTLGLERSSRAAWDATPQQGREELLPYIAGINAALARSPKPFEAQMLDDWIGPWQASDSIAWGKLLSLLLAPAWEQQLIRARIIETADLEALAALDPPSDPDAPVAAPPEASYGELCSPLQEATTQLSEILGLHGGASNNWAVAGQHTASGAPIFACDPHLTPVSPPHAYFVHLHCHEFNAAGASIPGLPGIIWGYNDRIAWGPTAAMQTMHIAVVEELSADGEFSRTPDGWKPVTTQIERIPVRGYPDETLELRETVNGPLVSEVLPPDLEQRWNGTRALSLHSRVLAPTHGGVGIAAILRARNWEEFCAAADNMRDFNLCYAYADINGRVGLRVSGDVPRGDPQSLRLPVAGWLPSEAGGVPQEALCGDQLPHTVDPVEGIVVSANSPLMSAAAMQFGAEYLDPARAVRIRELLAERRPHTRAYSAEMQRDCVSLPLRAFAEQLVRSEPSTEQGQRHLPVLADWDGSMNPESTAAAVAAATLIEYRRAELAKLLGDHGQDLLEPLLAIPTLDMFAARATTWSLTRIEADPESAATDLGSALDRAVRVLRDRFGPDCNSWSWGRSRQLILRHGLSDAPVIGSLLSAGPFAHGGEADTISQSGVLGLRHGEPVSALPALRLVVELTDPPQAEFVLAGEQVHEPLRPNGPMLDAWRHDRLHPLLRDRVAVEAVSSRRLRLEPYRPQAGRRQELQ